MIRSAKRCAKCGGKLQTIGTVAYDGSNPLCLQHRYRRRRYKCLDCGDRFSTYEVDERDMKRLVNLYKSSMVALNKAKRELDKCSKAVGEIYDNQP